LYNIHSTQQHEYGNIMYAIGYIILLHYITILMLLCTDCM